MHWPVRCNWNNVENGIKHQKVNQSVITLLCVGVNLVQFSRQMLMTYNGAFAIHQAAQCGHVEIAKTLFEMSGADTQLEVSDCDGNTPLLLAVGK